MIIVPRSWMILGMFSQLLWFCHLAKHCVEVRTTAILAEVNLILKILWNFDGRLAGTNCNFLKNDFWLDCDLQPNLLHLCWTQIPSTCSWIFMPIGVVSLLTNWYPHLISMQTIREGLWLFTFLPSMFLTIVLLFVKYLINSNFNPKCS